MGDQKKINIQWSLNNKGAISKSEPLNCLHPPNDTKSQFAWLLVKQIHEKVISWYDWPLFGWFQIADDKLYMCIMLLEESFKRHYTANVTIN